MPIPDLESVLGTRTRIRLLRALLTHTEPVSGREAQRLADTPSSSASGAALDELVDAGLLIRVEAGNAHLYRANREHLFWEPLARLFAVESGRDAEAARLVDEELDATDGPPPLAVIVLAPSANGGASDPDLLVVARDESEAEHLRQALPATLERVRRRLGGLGGAEVCALDGLRDSPGAREPLLERVFGRGRELLERVLRG